MAIAGLWQAATFNRPGYTLFDYDVYAVCGDGCLMEGIGAEAASLAGHQQLSNLCWIYDNNTITIEGSTSLAFTEDVAARFTGYGWAVHHVTDANDTAALAEASAAVQGGAGQADVDRRRQRHRLRRPDEGGHPLRARRAVGRRGDPRREAVLRLAGGPSRSTSRTACASTSPTGSGAAAPPRARSGTNCSPATERATRSSRTSSTGCSAAGCPTGGTPTCPSSPSTPRAWPAATPAARC